MSLDTFICSNFWSQLNEALHNSKDTNRKKIGTFGYTLPEQSKFETAAQKGEILYSGKSTNH